ncbi:uncharacterized protein LOC144421892 isoform X2 [Styela clava]
MISHKLFNFAPLEITLFILLLQGCTGQIVRMKIGILHDHYVDSQHIDAVYKSVVNFPSLFKVESDILIETKKFDLDLGATVYDELRTENFTALIVVGKKLKCDEVAKIKKQIPIYVVSGSFKSCDEYEELNSIIYLYPPDTFVLSAMLLATKEYEWKHAIVLGEKNDEFSFTFTSMQQARVENLETIAFEAVAEKSALRETLLSAKKAGIRAFIVMAQYNHVEMILTSADELELTDSNFYWFIPNAEYMCLPNPSDVLEVSTEATILTPFDSIHGHTTTSNMHEQTTSTTPSMHGHTPATTPSMHGHGTTTTPSMHGHTIATTQSMHGHTITSTLSMHGNTIATTPSTTTSSIMNEHTSTTTPNMNGHTTTTASTMNGHTTSTTLTMNGHTTTMNGHTTTTTSSMGVHTSTMNGHTTTTIPSIGGHTSTMNGHTTTATPSMDGHMTTTTSSMNGHTTTTTMTPSIGGHTSTMNGHTTTATPSMGGHMPTTTSSMNGHTATTTMITPSMNGHTTTTKSTMIGHLTTTEPSMNGHMAATSINPTSTLMHGHMKRSIYSDNIDESSCKTCGHKNYIHSFCSRKSCTTANRQRIKIRVNKDNDFIPRVKHAIKKRSLDNADSKPNSACVTFQWEDDIIEAAVKIVNVSSFYSEDNTVSESESITSSDGSTRASFDSCAISSIHKWDYQNDSCSIRLAENAEIPSSNTLFVVEYLSNDLSVVSNHGRSKNQERQPVVVGIYNSKSRSYINVMYEPLHPSDIFLPSRPLTIGAIYHPPWLTWKMNEVTGEEEFEGYLYEILEKLSISMNFSFQLRTEYNFNLDVHDDDAMEDYMMSVFNNNSVDFFLHAKSVRGNRLGKSNKVLLSASFQQPHMYLLTKRVEKTESVSIWQFMLPFREESWMLFWSTFILISLLMAYINKRNPNEYEAISHTFGPNSSPSDHLGVLNSLWFTFAAICGQGADIVPRSTACVMLTGTWWGFVLLVLSAYTANMTAFMTQVNTGGIETLDELASQQQFAYGMIENNAMLDLYLPGAKDAPYTTMYEYLHKFENNSILKKQEDGFEKVLNGNYYLLASFEAVVDALSQSCEFDLAGHGFYQYQFAFPFPQGSVYINMFNDYIKKLADKGVLAALEEKWFTLEKRCETNAVEKNLENQLDIKAFIGMYVFLILGVTSGILICVVETGWIKCGGFGGLFHRAGIYELEDNRKEIQKANELLKKEFESWEGGWDVWKFKEWKEDADDMNLKPSSEKKLFSPPPGLEKCRVCGRNVIENKSKVVEVPMKTEPSILEIPQVSKLTTNEDETYSNDSGRESASSGQLTITTEKSGTRSVEDTPQTASQNQNTIPTNLFDLTAATDFKTFSTHDQGVQAPSRIIVTADLHQPKYPMELGSSLVDKRLESALSSTVSHSSLASGTLSFLSDSEESVSVIHRRTPYINSRNSSRFAESQLTYDFGTPSSFYTTTSFGTHMESAYSRVSTWTCSSEFTCDSRIEECTEEDTHSDVTVINRALEYQQ